LLELFEVCQYIVSTHLRKARDLGPLARQPHHEAVKRYVEALGPGGTIRCAARANHRSTTACISGGVGARTLMLFMILRGCVEI
jgi:hypothetical protein